MLANLEMLQDIEKMLLDLEAQTPIGLRESSGFTHTLFCVRSLIVSENLREVVQNKNGLEGYFEMKANMGMV
tara:strand:+ start:385 stop:600 length:216 start_codon:yes stop_codon:yes gene_type:complete